METGRGASQAVSSSAKPQAQLLQTFVEAIKPILEPHVPELAQTHAHLLEMLGVQIAARPVPFHAIGEGQIQSRDPVYEEKNVLTQEIEQHLHARFVILRGMSRIPTRMASRAAAPVVPAIFFRPLVR